MKDAAEITVQSGWAARRAVAFRALRHRNFRLLWGGLVVSSLVMPMQWLVQSWLILQLTHSALDLGILGLARGLPMLVFGLWGGVLADRMDRRTLLIITQCLAAVLVTLLAVLIMADWVRVWHVFLITFLTGAVQSFDQPTRTALVPDLVPREDLANAVALTAVARQTGTALGPAGAGFLIEAIGMGSSYLLLAIGNAVIVLALLLMKLPARSIATSVRRSMARNLIQGVSFVRHHQVLPAILSMVLLSSAIGMATFSALNALVVSEVWHGNASLMGWFFTSYGAGAFLGGFALASIGERWPRGRLLLGSTVTTGIMMTFYAQVPWQLALVVLAGVGVSTTLTQVTSTALTQLLTPRELQGRVVSLLMLEMGMGQAGGIYTGAIATAVGPAATFTIMGGVILGVWGLLAVSFPRLRTAH